MKKYYFTSEIRGIVGKHSGNIRGAKTKAQKFAEQFDEEITILVRSNKEIDCGKNIPANEEVCRVCNADGDVLAVCSTYGNAFAWCAENGIEGEIGEYEPYIEVGTYSENGNFEVEDYSSIDTGDGMWNIINDYCDYVDTVCPETTETVETEEKAEEEIITMANTDTNASIAKAEEKKTQFDFYNVTIGFEVEKFIGTIPADYESLGIYSDYEKAVQAAQAAADEYGAENIYFRTVEIATRNDRDIYDREDYEFFVEERETIRHNWYTLTIVDTGKREHVNLDKPVRFDFEE